MHDAMEDGNGASLDDGNGNGDGVDEWKDTRWASTNMLERDVADAVESREPDRFASAVRRLEDALAAAREDGDFSVVHAQYSPTMTFLAGRSKLRRDDVAALASLAFEISHAVVGDVSAQVRWLGAATRVIERHGAKLRLSVDWRPLKDLVRTYLDGNATGYNGAVPLAVHQSVATRCAHKARRFFSSDAPREIWEYCRPLLRSLDSSDCFEGVALFHLLMPCMRVAEEDAKHPWREWCEEWMEMAGWQPSSRFWLAAFHAVFAQLAKHDVHDRIGWAKHLARLSTTTLWFTEIPVGGGEGGCPFGRRTP